MLQLLDALLNLPAFIGGLLLIGTHVGAGLVIYLVSHGVLFRNQENSLGDATRTMFLAVNLLFGLFLSLTLTDVVSDLSDIRDAVEREAVAISDVYNGLGRFDTDDAAQVQTRLIEYTETLIEEDWPSLANDTLSDKADVLLRDVVTSALALEADSRTEIRTWERISADLDLLSDYRLARLQHALAPPPFFLLVTIFGMIVVMVCMGLYPPSRTPSGKSVRCWF